MYSASSSSGPSPLDFRRGLGIPESYRPPEVQHEGFVVGLDGQFLVERDVGRIFSNIVREPASVSDLNPEQLLDQGVSYTHHLVSAKLLGRSLPGDFAIEFLRECGKRLLEHYSSPLFGEDADYVLSCLSHHIDSQYEGLPGSVVIESSQLMAVKLHLLVLQRMPAFSCRAQSPGTPPSGGSSSSSSSPNPQWQLFSRMRATVLESTVKPSEEPSVATAPKVELEAGKSLEMQIGEEFLRAINRQSSQQGRLHGLCHYYFGCAHDVMTKTIVLINTFESESARSSTGEDSQGADLLKAIEALLKDSAPQNIENALQKPTPTFANIRTEYERYQLEVTLVISQAEAYITTLKRLGNTEVSRQIRELEATIQALAGNQSQQADEKARYCAEIEQLHAELTEKNLQLAESANKVRRVEALHKRMYQELEEEIAGKESLHQGLYNALQTHHDGEVKELQSVIEAKTRELSELLKHHEQNQREWTETESRLKAELETAKSQLEQQQEAYKLQRESFQAESTKHNHAVEEASLQVEALQKQLKELHRAGATSQNGHAEELLALRKELENANRDLESKLLQANASIRLQVERNDKIQAELEVQNGRVQQLEQTKAALEEGRQADKKQFESALKDASAEIALLKKQQQELESAVGQLEAKSSLKDREIADLRQQLEESQARIQQVGIEHTEEIGRLHAQYQGQLQEAAGRTEQLALEKSEVEQKLSRLQALTAQLSDQGTFDAKTIEGLRKDFEQMQQAANAEKSALELEKDRLNKLLDARSEHTVEEIKQLQEKLATVNEQLQAANAQLTNAQSTIADLEQNFDAMQRAAAGEKDVLEATCKHLNEELNNRSRHTAEEISQLQTALDHANARLADSRADFVNQLSEMSRNAYADAEKKVGAEAEAARAKMRDEFAQALYKAVFKDLLYRRRLGRLAMSEEELKQTAYGFGASGQYDSVLGQMKAIYDGVEKATPSSVDLKKQERLLERAKLAAGRKP